MDGDPRGDQAREAIRPARRSGPRSDQAREAINRAHDLPPWGGGVHRRSISEHLCTTPQLPRGCCAQGGGLLCAQPWGPAWPWSGVSLERLTAAMAVAKRLRRRFPARPSAMPPSSTCPRPQAARPHCAEGLDSPQRTGHRSSPPGGERERVPTTGRAGGDRRPRKPVIVHRDIHNASASEGALESFLRGRWRCSATAALGCYERERSRRPSAPRGGWEFEMRTGRSWCDPGLQRACAYPVRVSEQAAPAAESYRRVGAAHGWSSSWAPAHE
jgi:hypothetical protein